jgi:integrase
MSKKGQKTTADPLSWEEFKRFLDELANDGEYKYLLIISFATFFGLRIGDVLKLKWKDLLGKKEVEIVEEKTGKTREIPIVEDVAKIILDSYLELNPNEQTIFTGYKGKVISRQQINRRLKQFKEKYNLNIRRFSTHSLRKCFGRRYFIKKGKTMEALITLSLIFNHTSVRTTMRYIGVTDDDIKKAYELITLNEQ